jgi:transcriptional regulator NrdR family protein
MSDNFVKYPGPNGANAVIPCPKCGGPLNNVVDSRPGRALDMDVIRRRRLCQCCGERASTLEIRADEVENFVARRNKMNEIFAALADVFSK